ncbi:hypothetical protein F3Y22_tig00112255pilonHSYRG00056 [Hibiscus syriacus]|uniref:Uncharacterized protein n=1 Tax=Hibiscus syriacus TaxID=106335 RepID=A0A6A2X349_HIBSY|nr:hypothetical protein F3Y22_tig00112255pilonHSYRG00056 [Hibiscus syriacus]
MQALAYRRCWYQNQLGLLNFSFCRRLQAQTDSTATPSLDTSFSLSPLLVSESTRALELQLLPSSSAHSREVTMLEEEATRLKELATKQLKLAMAEKAYAEKGRQEEKAVLL